MLDNKRFFPIWVEDSLRGPTVVFPLVRYPPGPAHEAGPYAVLPAHRGYYVEETG